MSVVKDQRWRWLRRNVERTISVCRRRGSASLSVSSLERTQVSRLQEGRAAKPLKVDNPKSLNAREKKGAGACKARAQGPARKLEAISGEGVGVLTVKQAERGKRFDCGGRRRFKISVFNKRWVWKGEDQRASGGWRLKYVKICCVRACESAASLTYLLADCGCLGVLQGPICEPIAVDQPSPPLIAPFPSLVQRWRPSLTR